MGMRSYSAAIALLVALASPAVAQAQVPKECLASYEAAQRERLKHDLEAARRELLVCQKPECPEVLRRECSSWLRELEEAATSIVVVARAGKKIVADVTVTLDGKVLSPEVSAAPIVLTPGTHRLQVESIDHDPAELTITVKAGEANQRIDVELPVRETRPATRAERNLVPVYVLAGLGAVGIGSFAFFGLRSHSRKNDLEGCKGHCPEDDVDRVKRDQLIADISLGVGVVCLAGATYLFLQGRKKTESVSIGLGWQSAAVRGAF